MDQYKQCITCFEYLPLEAFYRSNNKSGYYGRCKSCWSLIRKQTYEKNKNKALAYGSEYRAKNRNKTIEATKRWRKANKEQWLVSIQNRRARLLNAKIYEVTKRDIAKLLEKPCYYCGGSSQSIDHVVPLSRGGLHKIGNLVGACLSCNKRKNNKFITEWKMSLHHG